MFQTNFKPPRGTYKLERERRRQEIAAAEEANKTAAKVRDGWKCRWPETHKCRGILEGVHVFVDKGMGGDHGTVSGTWNLMALCSWIHRTGPRSIHSKDLWSEPMTDDGADGICSFWKRDEDGRPFMVAEEIAIGVIAKD